MAVLGGAYSTASFADPASAPALALSAPLPRPPGVDSAAGSTSADLAHDAQITADLKSAFLLTGWIDATHLSVVTRNGVVDLSGRAANATERALAIELARNVAGVVSVTTANLKQ
jgi:osmotically-inducible protein OsmY